LAYYRHSFMWKLLCNFVIISCSNVFVGKKIVHICTFCKQITYFYRAMRMYRADYAVERCPVLSWQSCHTGTARFRLTSFWPVLSARRVCIARTMMSQDVCLRLGLCLSARLSLADIVSKHLGLNVGL